MADVLPCPVQLTQQLCGCYLEAGLWWPNPSQHWLQNVHSPCWVECTVNQRNYTSEPCLSLYLQGTPTWPLIPWHSQTTWKPHWLPHLPTSQCSSPTIPHLDAVQHTPSSILVHCHCSMAAFVIWCCQLLVLLCFSAMHNRTVPLSKQGMCLEFKSNHLSTLQRAWKSVPHSFALWLCPNWKIQNGCPPFMKWRCEAHILCYD